MVADYIRRGGLKLQWAQERRRREATMNCSHRSSQVGLCQRPCAALAAVIGFCLYWFSAFSFWLLCCGAIEARLPRGECAVRKRNEIQCSLDLADFCPIFEIGRSLYAINDAEGPFNPKLSPSINQKRGFGRGTGNGWRSNDDQIGRAAFVSAGVVCGYVY